MSSVQTITKTDESNYGKTVEKFIIEKKGDIPMYFEDEVDAGGVEKVAFNDFIPAAWKFSTYGEANEKITYLLTEYRLLQNSTFEIKKIFQLH